jgi:hypothetical protein
MTGTHSIADSSNPNGQCLGPAPGYFEQLTFLCNISSQLYGQEDAFPHFMRISLIIVRRAVKKFTGGIS